jgi:uncharacterized protein
LGFINESAMDDFQVFVKPVGAVCNLDCQYCYYLEKQQLYPEKQGFRMPDDLLEEYIIQHISASPGPELFFSWHGGEPTLAGLQFFKRVVELQKKQVPENWTVINGLQTNGTLLSHEWCRFLKQEHFVVGISLDGPENIHSIFRYRKDRQACFDEVLRGYRLLRQYGIPCEILCVVSSANVGYPLEIYRYFKQLKVEFITFLPLVEKVTSPGQHISERTVNAKAFGEFLCTIFDEWKTSDIGILKIQLFEEALRTAFGLDHTLCIFKKTCGGIPVVEHNGDFYSCDHFVNEGYMLGNIRNTSLNQLLESPEQKAFGQAKLTSLPDYCLKCEVREMCNGACPKDRFIETLAGEKGLNYLCEGYKLFFNHCKPFVEQVAQVWQANNRDIV